MMANHHLIAVLLILLALLPLLAVFVVYPLYLYWRPARVKAVATVQSLPTVTMLIAARNSQLLIDDKLQNCLSLDYPKHQLNFIFFSDGSDDNTLSLLNACQDPRVTVLFDPQHIGKAAALNRSAEQTDADVLVFSDVDALLSQDAIQRLVDELHDPAVGGVCGQRAIAGQSQSLKHSQKQYIALDSWVKLQESRSGSLSANDGKLYAIKRQYFKPVAEGVTDDLYTALHIIRQHKYFVFAAKAIAAIKTPARNPQHEISRRRRITCRSLTGIFAHRALFNPKEYGRYGLRLFINKVLRRLFPLSLVCLFIANVLLLDSHFIWSLGFVAQLLIYTLVYLVASNRFVPPESTPAVLSKAAYALTYFVLGNIGMLLGGMDFLLRRKVIKWEPNKNDQ